MMAKDGVVPNYTQLQQHADDYLNTRHKSEHAMQLLNNHMLMQAISHTYNVL